MTLGQRRARTRLGDLSVQNGKDPAKGHHPCETFEEALEPRPTNLRLDDSKIIESEEVLQGVILDFNADIKWLELRFQIFPSAPLA